MKRAIDHSGYNFDIKYKNELLIGLVTVQRDKSAEFDLPILI
ncbi:hypothetical protein DSUL_30140 [Desulfovibrionales bacterium]